LIVVETVFPIVLPLVNQAQIEVGFVITRSFGNDLFVDFNSFRIIGSAGFVEE
jgi:hypothetical protein